MFNGMYEPRQRGHGSVVASTIARRKRVGATVPVPFFSANPPRGRKKSAAGLIQIKEPYSLG